MTTNSEYDTSPCSWRRWRPESDATDGESTILCSKWEWTGERVKKKKKEIELVRRWNVDGMGNSDTQWWCFSFHIEYHTNVIRPVFGSYIFLGRVYDVLGEFSKTRERGIVSTVASSIFSNNVLLQLPKLESDRDGIFLDHLVPISREEPGDFFTLISEWRGCI